MVRFLHVLLKINLAEVSETASIVGTVTTVVKSPRMTHSVCCVAARPTTRLNSSMNNRNGVDLRLDEGGRYVVKIRTIDLTKTAEVSHVTGEVSHVTGEVNHVTGEVSHVTGEVIGKYACQI